MSNFKLNRAGVKELMKSAAMQSILAEKASAIRSRCGDGYEVSSRMGYTRPSVFVNATTKQARADNLKNNTLLKARKG